MTEPTTYPGMAHPAGTGPAGKTCRECDNFGFSGILGNAPCFKAMGMAKGITPSFPHDAVACWAFRQADDAPPAFNAEVS